LFSYIPLVGQSYQSNSFELNSSKVIGHYSYSQNLSNSSNNYNVNKLTDEDRSPGGALLRSFIVPGWGHYYIDNDNWNRGRVHLLSDVILIGSYLGLNLNAKRLESNLYSFAKQHAGVDLKGKGRGYLLNVAEFSSIHKYNEFQERSRNWDQLYEITADNSWSWNSEEKRLSFLKLDNRIQNNRQQLPAIISLLVVNRIISGISAYSSASNFNNSVASTSITFSFPEFSQGSGMQANVRFLF